LSISIVLGTRTALAELAFFTTLRDQSITVSQTSLYLFLTLTQLIVIVSIRNRDHFWKAVRPSRPLVVAMVLTGVAGIGVTYLPLVRGLLSFRPPSLLEIGVVLLGSAIYVLALDLVKVAFYRVVDRRKHQTSDPETKKINH